MTETRGSGAVPLFLSGIAAAVAAEMALGLLVYTSPGFLEATTTIVVVQLAALAGGLATQPTSGRSGGRWRWFVALGAFLIAGLASVSWSLNADFMETWTTRGLSLTVLAGLPLYGVGLIISSMPYRRRGAGVPVVLGAAVGVALFGTVLFGRLQPFGIYLFGVMCVSIAAFITAGHSVLEARQAVRTARESLASEANGSADEASILPALQVSLTTIEPGDVILTPADLSP